MSSLRTFCLVLDPEDFFPIFLKKVFINLHFSFKL